MLLKAIYMDMKNHPHLNHAKQKTEIFKAHILHPNTPSYIHEESNVRILDPEGLVNKNLETHDLDA